MIALDIFPQKLTQNVSVFGNGYFPLYLIQGKNGAALFEVGSAAVARNAIEQLAAWGVSPNYVIISHPHADHITATPMLVRRFTHAKVFIGNGAQRFGSERQGRGIFRAEDEYAASFLRQNGVTVNEVDSDNAIDFASCLVATNNETVDLGGVKITLLETKGHSPGGLIAYVEEDGTLLASDSLGCPYLTTQTFFPLFFTDFAKYAATIDFIGAMDLSLLGLGHGAVVRKSDVAKTVKTARDCANSLRDLVLSHRGDSTAIVTTLMERYYRDDLRLYSSENIRECCGILARRSLET